MTTKLSKVSFFFYLLVYDYIWIRAVLFPYFYNHFGSMAFFYSILLALLVGILLALIPKKVFHFDYEKPYLQSKFKYFHNFLLALESLVGISFCSYVLSTVFVENVNILLLLFGIGIVISILSFLKPSDIIQIATLFSIVGMFLVAFSFIYYVKIDPSLLLPIRYVAWYAVPIFSVMMIADNLTILLIDRESIQLSKPLVLLPILVSLGFFSFEMFMLQTSAGSELLKDVNWVGFVCLSFKPVTKYVGNFDFAYIACIVICCVFKYALNWSVIRNSYAHKKKSANWIICALLVLGSWLCYLLVPTGQPFFMVTSVLLLLGILILFWHFKEVYYVRRVKKQQ